MLNNVDINRRNALKTGAAMSALLAAGCGRGGEAPSSKSDLAGLDAVSTASAIKNGDVTASDVVNAAIDRAAAVNPQINAIVTPYFDSARAQASEAGGGAWFGVPSFIKDLNNVIGQRSTHYCPQCQK